MIWHANVEWVDIEIVQFICDSLGNLKEQKVEVLLQIANIYRMRNVTKILKAV